MERLVQCERILNVDTTDEALVVKVRLSETHCGLPIIDLRELIWG